MKAIPFPKKILYLLCFIFVSYNTQTSLRPKQREKLEESIQILDRYMKENNPKLLEVLCQEVSFGHSNGWIQGIKDIKDDFSNKKVAYKEVQQLGLMKVNKYKNIANVRRTIKVSGEYKNREFTVKLAVLELWRREKSLWKLWSRQSIEIKT